MSEFIKKLVKVQGELKAPKTQNNSFGKYKYRSAEDILEAVKPLNVANELFLTLTDEPILIGEWHYIKATASITDGKDSHEVTAYAREPEIKKGMDSSQITGTASSYARKYALNGLYLIDDTKDADTDEYRNQGNRQNNNNNQRNNNQNNYQQQNTQQQQAPSGPKMITAAQLKAIGAITNTIAKRDSIGQGAVYEKAQQALGISKGSRELTASEASKFIEFLKTLEQ